MMAERSRARFACALVLVCLLALGADAVRSTTRRHTARLVVQSREQLRQYLSSCPCAAEPQCTTTTCSPCECKQHVEPTYVDCLDTSGCTASEPSSHTTTMVPSGSTRQQDSNTANDEQQDDEGSAAVATPPSISDLEDPASAAAKAGAGATSEEQYTETQPVVGEDTVDSDAVAPNPPPVDLRKESVDRAIDTAVQTAFSAYSKIADQANDKPSRLLPPASKSERESARLELQAAKTAAQLLKEQHVAEIQGQVDMAVKESIVKTRDEAQEEIMKQLTAKERLFKAENRNKLDRKIAEEQEKQRSEEERKERDAIDQKVAAEEKRKDEVKQQAKQHQSDIAEAKTELDSLAEETEKKKISEAQLRSDHALQRVKAAADRAEQIAKAEHKRQQGAEEQSRKDRNVRANLANIKKSQAAKAAREKRSKEAAEEVRRRETEEDRAKDKVVKEDQAKARHFQQQSGLVN